MRLTYRVSEVAEMLGVSEESIRRQIAARRLPASKLGTAVLVKTCELERFIRSFPEAVPATAPARFRRASATQTVSLERARALRDAARRA